MYASKAYLVAGFPFKVKADEKLLERMGNMKPFEAEGQDGPLFELDQVETVAAPEGESLFCTQDGPEFPEIAIRTVPEGHLFRMRPLPGKPVAVELQVNEDFTKACMKLSGTDDVFGLNNSLMLLYAFASARSGALEMHSSVVMHDGKGYLFLGKSGTGKSTHSRLWLKNIPDTELLNDDNPVLRLMPDGSARVFGSPWSGKTPCYKAQDVPVGAIVRIEQAPQNAIRRLNPLEAYASVMASASAFRPFKELSDGWHRTLESLAAIVPCYTLRCLPDDAAALLCHKTVHG